MYMFDIMAVRQWCMYVFVVWQSGVYIVYLQLVLEQGGIQPGGLNFDAKLRRESIAIEDMFIAHIGKVTLGYVDPQFVYAAAMLNKKRD